MVADNPASNELSNLVRCFISNACKYCEIYYKQIREFNLFRMPADEWSFSEDHIFKDLDISGLLYAPDIFHDLFEGVIEIIVNTILKKCGPDQWKEINSNCQSIYKKWLCNMYPVLFRPTI